MTRLDAVLARYVDDGPELGPGSRPLAREGLIEELRAVRDRNAKYFAGCAGMLALVFIGAGTLVVMSLERPGQLSMVFAATGVSIPWIIKMMAELWKQKVASDLLLALVATLKPEVTRAAVAVVAAQLSGRGAPVDAPRRPARVQAGGGGGLSGHRQAPR